MNESLKRYMKRYVELEYGIRRLIDRQGGRLCEQCTCCCCDPIICSEAIESPFLKRVHGQAGRFDGQSGFLSITGCVLKQGRPPTCYQYFCDNHFYYQPDELHVEVLQKLGGLLNHVIRNAFGDISLVEILSESDIERVDFSCLERQLDEGFEALRAFPSFYNSGVLSAESKEIFEAIRLVV